MKKVFIGYSLEDGSHLNALKKYLKPLELEELIQVCEGFISEELVDPNLEKELKNADILIFLFSTDMLSQKFIWGQEMKHILEKAKNGDIQFIPVIIKDCLLEDTPFDLPRETNPISNLLNNEEGWMKVIKEIRKATFEHQQKNQNPAHMSTPKRVFIGSAQADAAHVDTLKKHLKLYERQNLIQIWDESMLIPGEVRKSKIEQELHGAHIILLLFSADLLAEDFIWGAEMNKILEKVKRREVQLIPILLRSSTFADTPFSAYAAVPERDKPISSYNNKDEAWTIVVEQIKRCIQDKSPSNFNTEANTMKIEQLKTKVRELIAKAKPQEAINEIKKWALENNDRPLLDETVLVEGTFAKLEKEVRQGTVYPQDAGIRQSQINSSILNLPNQASTPTPEDVTPPEVKPETGINGKLKILMLTANPAGSYQLELEKEHSRITKKLQEKTEQFSLIVHHAVNNTEFKELNETAKPNILHFSGHGDSNGIMLQNDDKNGSKLLTANALDALFEYFVDEGILFKAVVLNACYSEDQAKAIANYVPYVIASTTEISDEAAIAFSVGFYFKLDAQGGNIEQSFRSGRTQAVTTGAEKSYFALYKDGAKIEA